MVFNKNVSKYDCKSEILDLPELTLGHLQRHPFKAPEHVSQCTLYYEGSFDPFGIHHLSILRQALHLGFCRASLGIVFQNPYKARKATPYTHRRMMAKMILEAEGLTVIDSLEEFLSRNIEGIFIPSHPLEFHHIRECALRNCWYHILIGPDNFERAMTSDVLWCHVPEWINNPHSIERYGFRSLYNLDSSFADRILVAPYLYESHSTHIRNGKLPFPEPINEYIHTHKLYGTGKSEIVDNDLHSNPFVSAPQTVLLSTKELLKRESLISSIKGGIEETGLYTPKVEKAMRSEISKFDKGEMIELRQELLFLKNTKSRNKESSCSSPLSEVCKKLRTALIGGLFSEASLTSAGGQFLVEALETDKKVLLVSNYYGWGSFIVLFLALMNENIGSISNRINYFGDPLSFPNIYLEALLEHSIRRTTIFSSEKKQESFFIEEIPGNQINLMFPVHSTSDRRLHAPNDSLRKLFSDSSKSNIALENMLIVPSAQLGAKSITDNQGINRDYIKSVFGPPIEGKHLSEIVKKNGGLITMHLIGRLIAAMLPDELRGIYGPVAMLEYLGLSEEEKGIQIRAAELLRDFSHTMQL